MEEANIVCILDKSGSMSSYAKNVVESYNIFLEAQSKERGDANLSLVLFNNKIQEVYKNKNIKAVPSLMNKEYKCDYATALYDAIGKTIKSLPQKKKHYVIIQTDGYENDSTSFSSSDIKDLVGEKKKEGWGFLFMGADIDVKSVAKTLGLEDDSVEFNKNSTGIETAFGVMSRYVSNYRCSLDTKKLYPALYNRIIK